MISEVQEELGKLCRKLISLIRQPVFKLMLCRYTFSFDEALKEAAESKPEERRANMLESMKASDARKAHPTLEHILPMHVAAGAAGLDVGERLWTLPEGSLSWAQYRFGKL